MSSTSQLRLGFLGPISIWDGHQAVALSDTRARSCLARLMLEPGTPITRDLLADAIYNRRPPRTAQNQVQRAVSVLRRHKVDIETYEDGYILRIEQLRIDGFAAEAMIEQARQAHSAECDEEAVELFRTALQFWRGPVLCGLDSADLQLRALPWEELRLIALEERTWAELRMGKGRDLVPELTNLVHEHCLHQPFHEQLMLALFRAGRPSEAVNAYHGLRERLEGELGEAPRPTLKKLLHRIAMNDSSLLPGAPSTSAPRQLPRRLPVIEGRKSEIDSILSTLAVAGPGSPVVVSGPGGVGKTTVATGAAHQALDLFPDGQLFAELSGSSDPAMPANVLGDFLRDLGVSEQNIPDDVEQRAKLFRSVVADRRLLMVLDNAANTTQVEPLLPGVSSCRTIITSRRPLTELPGATLIRLFPLSDLPARAILADSGRRLDVDPAAVHALIELCQGYPLALKIVAARLAAKPHWSFRKLLNRILGSPVDEMASGELRVRPLLDSNYQMLDDQSRSLLRRVGFYGQHHFSLSDAAALADCSQDAAEDLLDNLIDAHFVEPGYRGYLLVLDYARGRAVAEESETELLAALTRVLKLQRRKVLARD
ncbi:DNA-binding transcriptional activator of the SARP family [Nonomuraea solani]|uniref:DNA-binding transcriptional activator of the SARP family n=1 Tax=Nonomuraea solani TaxID=1144553 RepID=A0A1H6F088_9ACTN|nr:BTAD domain-containing putative transcriptional regulator [Nonomuraea solani]SEH02354.1 DNA-binding transcriptional activator of the SARP family [Nonomuraea solani]